MYTPDSQKGPTTKKVGRIKQLQKKSIFMPLCVCLAEKRGNLDTPENIQLVEFMPVLDLMKVTYENEKKNEWDTSGWIVHG